MSGSSSSSLHILPKEENVGDNSYEYLDPPLHRACALNDCDKILEFIREGKDLNLCDYGGYTALHCACRNESVEAVKILVEQPLIRLDVQCFEKRTPLHVAAIFNKSPAIIKILIEAGCDVHVTDYKNNTALYEIIRKEKTFKVKVEMSRLLLENGFDLTRVDNHFLLILILQPPSDVGDEECFKDYLNFISMFLYYNIDVNCHPPDMVDEFGRTAFQIFLSYNRIAEVFDLFIDYVDDLNYGCTASDSCLDSCFDSYLMQAIQCESPRILEMVNKGADINFKNQEESCLDKTLQCKNNQLFKYFWTHCNLDEVLDEDKEFLYKVLVKTRNYPPKDFFETLYMILESKYINLYFEWSIKDGIYSVLIRTFLERRYLQEDRLKILYTLLSINNKILCDDLLFVYESYGFSEEFEAFLIVNAQVLNNRPFINEDNSFFYIINPRLKLKYAHFPLSLKELSRDTFRMNIKSKLLNPNSICLNYYGKVLGMPIPKSIKNIILLKDGLSEVFVK